MWRHSRTGPGECHSAMRQIGNLSDGTIALVCVLFASFMEESTHRAGPRGATHRPAYDFFSRATKAPSTPSVIGVRARWFSSVNSGCLARNSATTSSFSSDSRLHVL